MDCDAISPGILVRTSGRLDSTTGFLIKEEYLKSRQAGLVGQVQQHIPGHGKDAWYVRHENGSIGAYGALELDKIETSTLPSVPCGVAVLVVRDLFTLSILLGKRIGAHEEGTWGLPGGRILPGEHPKDAAARELYEETGVAVSSGRPVLWPFHPYNSVVVPDGGPWLTLFFWVHVSPYVRVELREPDKCEEWKFHRVNALPHNLFEPAKVLADAMKWEFDGDE